MAAANDTPSQTKDAAGDPILSLKRKASTSAGDSMPPSSTPQSAKKKIRRTFKKIEIDGDGNCLFRAFSQHFNGAEDEYEGVRHRIVKYVEKNWTQFQPKVSSVLSTRLARSARQYASYMGKDKTFGSEVEILAASLLYKTPIRVYLKKAKRFLPTYESGGGNFDLIAAGLSTDGVGSIVNPVKYDDGGGNFLYLEYDEDNLHYNVLMPIAVETQVLTNGETPESITKAASATPGTAVADGAKPILSDVGSPRLSSTPAAAGIAPPPAPVGTAAAESPVAAEPRVTPKALFVNKNFNTGAVVVDGPGLNNTDLDSSAALSPRATTPLPPPSSSSIPNRSSRSGTPTRGAAPSTRSTPAAASTSVASRLGLTATTPIVVRDCYVPLPRTPTSSRRNSLDAGNPAGAAATLRQQQQRLSLKHRPLYQPPRVMALCLCSTRDPAFLTPVTRAAKRHLSQYETMRKRQASHRVTRMRGAEGALLAAASSSSEDPSALGASADGSTKWEAMERMSGGIGGGSGSNKLSSSPEIVAWPYLLHSLADCPNEIFLYHLLFCLFAASQEPDEAFVILARYVFFLQREEIDKYLTAYNLEFTSHDEETLQKILSHYRKSLKRDVAALRKEWVDMYFAHEEIDHPCRPTDLSSRQNCVIFILDSRHEEHHRLLARLSDHLPYVWKRSSTPLIGVNGIPATISLSSLNSIVDLAVNAGCDDFADSIVHHHPTKNSIEREIRLLTHHVAVAADNSFQLSVYPKDSLLIDGDAAPLKTASSFMLRDSLVLLARQSDDLLTFERHQIIGDRIADTHLMETASSRYRVGLCLPTEEWVDASVFFEKALADLLDSMKTSAADDRGFLFLPALNRGRRPFHPFVDGAPLRRLARQADYRVDFLTASRPAEEPVSIVLVQVERRTAAPTS